MLWFDKKQINGTYLTRWHVIPRNRYFNIYLHRFTGDDDARALHDHPWDTLSIRLRGSLREYYKKYTRYSNETLVETVNRVPPRFCFRKAEFAHRLELIGHKPCWTIFITGRVQREWGFHCPKGWQHWRTMTMPKGEKIGGCE